MTIKIQTIICCLLCTIAFSQNSNKNIVVLKTWKIDNSKELSKQTRFKFDENGKTKSFYLETNKKEILLKEALSNTVIEKYKLRIPSNPTKTCADQEKEQWEYFNKNIYPYLLKLANKNCKRANFCLQIFCNGSPTVAYLMFVKPNSKKCKWSEAISLSEISKYDFKMVKEKK